MKKLVFIIILTIATGVFAQKNLVFIELLGNGGFASLNYERQLTNQPGLSLRLGIGVSFFETAEDEPCDPENPYCDFLALPVPHLSFPLSMLYLVDLKKNNYLETGLGYTHQFGSKDRTWSNNESAEHVIFANLGFRRYFGKERKWMWKLTFTPIVGIADSKTKVIGFGPWAGLSLGKRF